MEYLYYVIFAGIFYRLFDLQISQNIKYLSLSDRNRLREWKLAPQRGVFKDYFGKVIADNTQVFQAHIIPEDVEDVRKLLFRLKMYPKKPTIKPEFKHAFLKILEKSLKTKNIQF